MWPCATLSTYEWSINVSFTISFYVCVCFVGILPLWQHNFYTLTWWVFVSLVLISFFFLNWRRFWQYPCVSDVCACRNSIYFWQLSVVLTMSVCDTAMNWTQTRLVLIFLAYTYYYFKKYYILLTPIYFKYDKGSRTRLKWCMFYIIYLNQCIKFEINLYLLNISLHLLCLS